MVRFNKKTLAIDSFVSHYQCERPINWSGQFKDTPRPSRSFLEVEIGSGLGEFLVRTALSKPTRYIVGIELEWERVKKALHRIARVKHEQGEDKLRNLRLLQVDAVVALERLFSPRSMHRVYCLFPCPWPKKGHIKHRLFSHEFLKLLNSRLADAGEVQIITDYYDYYEWILNQIQDTGFSVQTARISPQFDTKYERKWCEEGQEEFYEILLTKTYHINIPVKEDAALKVYFIDQFDPNQFVLHNVTGEISIIGKEFLFDPQKKRGMVHVIVAEKNITQHVWIAITKNSRGWCIAKAEGHTVLPTKGVAQAIRLVYNTILQQSVVKDLPSEDKPNIIREFDVSKV